MPDQIFSNYNYYKNKRFNSCLREYNDFMKKHKTDQSQLSIEEWENWALLIHDDFYMAAKCWLIDNKKKTAWRKDLK